MGSNSARAVDVADKPVMVDASLVAVCCARCGTNGLRADGWVCEEWVCYRCGEPFVINGEPVLSLDGLDRELDAGGLYCERCCEQRPPFEHAVCPDCSAAGPRIGEVLEQNRRERDDGERGHAGHNNTRDHGGGADDDPGHDEGEGNHGVDDGPVYDVAEDDAAEDDGGDGGDDDGGDDEHGGGAGRDDGARDHGDDDAGDGSPTEAPVEVPEDLPDDGIDIDPEIEALLPRESPDEYARLLQNLLAEGCRDKLVVWQDGPRLVLLDGHIRRTICRARHILYEKEVLELPDRTSAIAWVINNQLGRRNLTPMAQAYLRGKLYNAHKRQGARTDLTGQSDQRSTLAERMAGEYGVSEKTIRRDAEFAELLDQFGEMYEARLKKAVLMRGAKMTRARVAQALELDAPTRDRIVALVKIDVDVLAVLTVLRKVLKDRADDQPRPPRACGAAEDDADHVEVRTRQGEDQGREGERPGHELPSGGRNTDDLDQRPLAAAMRILEDAARELEQGELSPYDARRLERDLTRIEQLAAHLRQKLMACSPVAPLSPAPEGSTVPHCRPERLEPGLPASTSLGAPPVLPGPPSAQEQLYDALRGLGWRDAQVTRAIKALGARVDTDPIKVLILAALAVLTRS